MAWVYALIAVGIVGLIMEICLSYNLERAGWKDRSDAIRAKIDHYRQVISVAKKKVGETLERVDRLKEEKAQLVREVNVNNQLLLDLEEKDRHGNPTKYLFTAAERDAS